MFVVNGRVAVRQPKPKSSDTVLVSQSVRGLAWDRRCGSLPLQRRLRIMDQHRREGVRMGLFGAPRWFAQRSGSSSARASVETELSRDRIRDSAVAKYWDALLDTNALEAQLEQLSDQELAAKTTALRQRAEASDGALRLAEVFATVREAARRTLGMRPFDVQILGGLALFHGCVAEIATGEGKTLVATLPACAAALSGRGSVLIVTVNDYLCRRDFENMGPLYRFLGLSVGCVTSTTTQAERQHAYACDVTYVTNAELGFDYLRDHLVMNATDQVLMNGKPFFFCLLDEADSIMIDEARTPLIISQAADAPAQKYARAAQLAEQLQRGRDYTVYEKERNVTLSGTGYKACERALKVPTLFASRDPWAPFVLNALKAKELYRRDIDYIVRDGQISIVDEFTGRVLQGRRWSEGLHQAIEAKEGLVVRTEPRTVASISYQSFFRLFPRLAGMTGTASTDAKEIHDIYGLKVVVVPTALPNVRRDYPDVVFRTRRGKLQAVAAEIRRLHKRKAPVLVGTTSIDASEQISALLLEGDPVPHEVLNARPENAERENEIVAQAGRLRAVTIATNMAGRGTDIMLGGNMATLSRSLLQERLWQTLQSDEDESSERSATSIDRLLPSLSESELRTVTDLCEQVANVLRPYCSADVQRHTAGGGLREWLHRLMLRALELDDRKETFPELATSTVKDALQRLQALLRPAMESEREMILELGGLHIIGTERHESRRVDNQLRGRAGRQGDPGCSRFFLSLEDPLFRVFGGDRIARLAEAFRLDETTPIESTQVARTLDNVQTNIEQYYADIRKQLFAYDEVLAKQRTVLYNQRNRLLIAGRRQLFGEGVLADTALGGLVGDWIRTTIDEIIRVNQRDASKCIRKLMEFFPGTELDESMLQAEKGTQRIIEAVGYRLLQQRRTMEQVAPEQDVAVFRYLALTQHDQLWSEHLRKLALLRDMSALQSLRQVDPLQQYQSDGFVLFEEMLSQIRRNTIYSFFLYTPLGTANRHQ